MEITYAIISFDWKSSSYKVGIYIAVVFIVKNIRSEVMAVLEKTETLDTNSSAEPRLKVRKAHSRSQEWQEVIFPLFNRKGIVVI